MGTSKVDRNEECRATLLRHLELCIAASTFLVNRAQTLRAAPLQTVALRIPAIGRALTIRSNVSRTRVPVLDRCSRSGGCVHGALAFSIVAGKVVVCIVTVVIGAVLLGRFTGGSAQVDSMSLPSGYPISAKTCGLFGGRCALWNHTDRCFSAP